MPRSHRNIYFAVLAALILAAAAGLYLTGTPAGETTARKGRSAPQVMLVDSRPLDTARSLLKLADTPQEADLARDAMRLGDHAVDLAFSSALREAHNQPVVDTPEIKQLQDRIGRLQSRIQSDQDNIKQLTNRIAHPARNEKENLQEEVDLAQARLSLRQDQLDDAKQDLIRAGGDRESQIQAMLDQHEAQQNANKQSDELLASNKQPFHVPGTLAAQFGQWRSIRFEQQTVLAAQAETNAIAQDLSRKHDQLEKSLQAQQVNGAAAPSPASSQASSPAGSPAPAPSTADALARLKSLSGQQKRLAAYDRRVDTLQQLAQVYGQWAEVNTVQRRQALHATLRSLLLILLIVLAVLVSETLIVRFLPRTGPDRRRLATMRMALQFAVRGVALLIVLIIVFGPPSQLSTVLALAGAGLTVVLKDFIVAFFGWFVLMGRHGIRVGDWVEIDGISGEVVEIGLLRTYLLEAGNWTDSGHPTGRKVAFVNSFAIEGHYFNFSTSGQWLWDELDVQLTADEDPFAVSDAIQKIVEKETKDNGVLAEKEWQRTAHGYHVRSFAPAINVRPSAGGMKILVRYITTAGRRQQMRDRLYEDIVDLLRGRPPRRTIEEAEVRRG